MTDYGFIRVSTGSQDAQTQRRDILAAYPDAQIISTDTRSASASKGAQLDAIDALIARLAPGDLIIVTESSRLDRREDLDAQAEVLLRVRQAGGDVLSIAEPQFGKTDFAGRIITLVAQHGNAEKSLTVKRQTYRGVSAIIANHAFYGPLPMLWEASGERYGKQARCINPDGVRDIFKRLDAGESILSVSRLYDVYPQSLRKLLRFEANHTGVIRCSYTYAGETTEWAHEVTPVIDSATFHRVNSQRKPLAGGRPVAQPANWISGIFQCPECGGNLFVNSGYTPAGKPRTPKLRCGGFPRTRQACGQFKGTDVAPVIAAVSELFANDGTKLLAYDRVSGNAHELAAMEADLARLQARLSVTEDDDALDALVEQRRALRAAAKSFVVVPDTFDYVPTGQTVGQFWQSGDNAKRKLLKAIRRALQGTEVSLWDALMTHRVIPGSADKDGVVDLGDGICFKPTGNTL